MQATADVVIVGAGIMGASTAYHLARRRAGRVVVVERDTVPSWRYTCPIWYAARTSSIRSPGGADRASALPGLQSALAVAEHATEVDQRVGDLPEGLITQRVGHGFRLAQALRE